MALILRKLANSVDSRLLHVFPLDTLENKHIQGVRSFCHFERKHDRFCFATEKITYTEQDLDLPG